MAFCTACGAPVDNSARACPKCGAVVTAVPTVTASAPPRAPAMQQTGGSSALRIALIVVAVVIALGICGAIGTVFVLKKVAHRVRVEAGPNSATITTPSGTVTTDDPAVVARQLGVEVYPGARGIQGGASVAFGNMQVVAAKFESDAAPDKVFDFYQHRYPKARIRVVGKDNSMVVSTDQGMVTIKVHPRGDGSLLEIARIAGGPGGNDESGKPN